MSHYYFHIIIWDQYLWHGESLGSTVTSLLPGWQIESCDSAPVAFAHSPLCSGWWSHHARGGGGRVGLPEHLSLLTKLFKSIPLEIKQGPLIVCERLSAPASLKASAWYCLPQSKNMLQGAMVSLNPFCGVTCLIPHTSWWDPGSFVTMYCGFGKMDGWINTRGQIHFRCSTRVYCYPQN